jgi:tripartite-type tricarboxylate transporter receptor subunit TctC
LRSSIDEESFLVCGKKLMMSRIGCLCIGCATLAPFIGTLAHAQYPAKQIRLIVPNAPGGGADTSARIVAQGLSAALGRSMVVENRPGAGGNLSAEIAARAAPDGYSVLWGSASHAVGVSLYSRPGYDLIRDFTPIALLVLSPYGVALHPSLPARSIRELIALARSRPGHINYATSGSATFLAAALFFDSAGVRMTNVSYKGGAPGLVALLSGEVSMTMTSVASILPHARSGKARLLAVTSAQRSASAPEYPTVNEAGLKGFDAISWYGLMVPAGTPPEVISRLLLESQKLIRQPEVRERLIASGIDPAGNTPEDFAAYVRSEVEKWARVIKATGAKPD